MAKSQETFSKKEKEKKRQKKREEKQRRKEERKANKVAGNLENMMAYIDENGNIVDTPPDETKPNKKIDASEIEIGVPKKDKEEKTARRKGRVEFFNDSKGFGFIKDVAKHQKYFVHIKNVKDDIQEGDMVTFELAPGLKGFDAVDVTKA